MNLSKRKRDEKSSKGDTSVLYRADAHSEKVVIENLSKSMAEIRRKQEHMTGTVDKKPKSIVDIDGGWAWIVTAGGFIMHFIMGSLTFCVGIFTVEISKIFGLTKTEVSVVASLLMGFNFCAAPVASVLMVKFGCRVITIFGALLVSLGLILSAYSHNIHVIYLTLGVLPGFGMCLSYTSTIIMVSSYFNKKRSIATGICISGTGLGSVAMAPILQYLFEIYGWRGTLLIVGGLVLNLAVSGCTYRPLKNQVRELSVGEQQRTCRLRMNYLLKTCSNWQFVTFVMATTTGMTILFTPFVFLPDYTIRYGISFKDASFIMAIMSVANAMGRALFGVMGRFLNTLVLLIITTVLAGVSIIVFVWCATFATITACAVLYGLSFGGLMVLLYVTFVDIMGVQTLETTFGILTMCQGFAISIGPIILGSLFDSTGSYDAPFIFSGCLLIASGIALVPLRIFDRKEQKYVCDEDSLSESTGFLDD